MFRSFLVALALAVCACGPSGKLCVDDMGCPSGEVCGADGRCVPAMAGGGGGATGGGGGATGGGGGATGGGGGATGGGGGATDAGSGGGGGDVDAGSGGGGGEMDAGPITCAPACPDWQECVGTSCLDRYTGLTLSALPRTNTSFSVAGALVLAPGRTSASAPALVISATRDGGAEPASFASMGGDTFTSTDFPATEGTWEISVSWPDAGLSATSTTVVDTTPPALTITIDPPPTRIVDGGLDQTDPQAPGAFRRDERATLHVRWSDPNLDPTSLRVRLGDVTWSPADGGLAPADGGLDRALELWLPTLNAFRGSLALDVSASDDVGNAGSTDAGIALTRLRWTRAEPIQGSIPVSDLGGTTFLGSPAPASIKSISREGLELWSRASVGEARQLALGSVLTADKQLLYVLEDDPVGYPTVVGEAFPAYRSTAAIRTWLPSSTPASVVGPVILSDTTVPAEGAFLAHVDTATSKTALRWADITGVTLRTATRVPTMPISAVNSLGAFIGRGHELYVAGDNRIFGFSSASDFSAPEESPAGYPGTLVGFSSIGNTLAIEGTGSPTSIVGTGVASGLFRPFRMAYPASPPIQGPTSVGLITSLVVASGMAWYLKTETISGGGTVERICHAIIGGAETCSSDNGESVTGFPVLAAGGRLVTIATRGSQTVVQERDRATLAVRWEGPGRFVPFSLTCGPSGATGHLLIADSNGLSSIVTDAKGLDASADWPMIFHDPQSTRNGALSLSPFQCP